MANILIPTFGAYEDNSGKNNVVAFISFLRHFSYSEKDNNDDIAHYATPSNSYVTVASIDKQGTYVSISFKKAGRYMVHSVDTYGNYTLPVANGIHTFAANKVLKWEKTVNAGGECAITIIYLGETT